MADALFAPKDFNKADLANLHIENYNDKIGIVKKWQEGIINGKILSQKEEQLQFPFLQEFFGKLLEYPYEKQLTEYMLENEFKSFTDGKKPDGALGYFRHQDGKTTADIRAVIELKDANTNLDKKQNRVDFKGSPVEQAFSYVPKMGGGCKWVIVSNFIEIRFYHAQDISRYEKFNILELLQNDNLRKFIYLLHRGQLFLENQPSQIDRLFGGRIERQKNISNDFYKEYKLIRESLYYDIRKHNSHVAPTASFRCTQKMIDRIIFICFVKDMQIISDVLKRVREVAEDSFSDGDERVWKELKHLFKALDKGYARKNIPPFNGGLFKADAIMDSLHITDFRLLDLLDFATKYDFQSDVDVNILGHIFEQSISDIEEILSRVQKDEGLAAAVTGLEELKAPDVSKRKKEGVFYTPAYITRYIVEQSVGAWLHDREKEILEKLKIESLPELSPDDYQSIEMDKKGRLAYNKAIALQLEYWQEYEKALIAIKVLDPACGSGAFLTQVLDYLFNEWKILKNESIRLSTPWKETLKIMQQDSIGNGLGMKTILWNEWEVKKRIISTNIYGVDINPESVEISKLSLWLKTANRTESLAGLEENIRLGNSLIDDPEVAGELAFDWNKEFKEIMGGGGFDVVVGNPPYVQFNTNKEYYKQNYKVSQSGDLYALFIERGVSFLKNDSGLLSFIVPSLFIKGMVYESLRNYLVQNVKIIFIEEQGDGVFEDVQMPTTIIKISNSKDVSQNWNQYISGNSIAKIIEDGHPLLNDLSEIIRGLEIGKDKLEDKIQSKNNIKIITGEDISRYNLKGIHTISDEILKEFKKDGLTISGPRLLIRETGERLTTIFLNEEMLSTRNLYTIKLLNEDLSYKYVLGLLNSTALQYYYLTRFKTNTSIFPKIRIAQVREIPIPLIKIESQTPFIQKVDTILSKNKELQEHNTTFFELLKSDFNITKPNTKLKQWYDLDWKGFKEEIKKSGAKTTFGGKIEENWLERFNRKKAEVQVILDTIHQTDKEIDAMVYELYGLTEEEIRVVEGINEK